MTLPVIGYVELVSNIAPLGAGLFRFRAMGREMTLFFILLLAGFVTEIVTLIMGRHGMNNWWVLQYYHLLEFLLLATVLASWQKRAPVKRILWAAIVVFPWFWAVAKWTTIEPLWVTDNITHSVSSVIILIVAVYSLLQMVKETDLSLTKESRFWILAGVVLYFSGSLMLFVLFEEISAFPWVDALTPFMIHWELNTVVNILFMIGYLMIKR
jgi:hypothetical protein